MSTLASVIDGAFLLLELHPSFTLSPTFHLGYLLAGSASAYQVVA
jgi:hypothetical protein